MSRPSITAAQVVGLLALLVPVAAHFGEAFGIFAFNAAQQDAVNEFLKWTAVAAAALFVSDAGLRASRNHADAKVQAAHATNPVPDLGDPGKP